MNKFLIIMPRRINRFKRSRSRSRSRVRPRRTKRARARSGTRPKRAPKVVVRHKRRSVTDPKIGGTVRYTKDKRIANRNPQGITSAVLGFTKLPSKWSKICSIRPTHKFAQHKYTSFGSFDTGTGGSALYVQTPIIRGNNIFDPDVALGGHQPEGVDYMKTQYTNYRCHGSEIKVTIYKTDVGALHLRQGGMMILRAHKTNELADDYVENKFLTLPGDTSSERLKEIKSAWCNDREIHVDQKRLMLGQFEGPQGREAGSIVLRGRMWARDIFIHKDEAGVSETAVVPFFILSSTGVGTGAKDTFQWSIGLCKDQRYVGVLANTVDYSVEVTYFVEWRNNDAAYTDAITID